MSLELFWWRGNKRGSNFGDELSRDTVAYVSGQDVIYKPSQQATLFAIGSILERARVSAQNDPAKHVTIWGSGLMSPAGFPGPTPNFKVAAVRGPLTRSALGPNRSKVPMGDPGLLIDRVFGINQRAKLYSVGIVAHHKQKGNTVFQELQTKTPGSIIIDVGQHPKTVAVQISECDCVVSTSLHGLIVADAMCVPNIWAELDLLHAGGRFKFFDYFLGVQRAVFEPLSIVQLLQDPTNIANIGQSMDYSYQQGLELVKDRIYNSFPQKLRRPSGV